MYFQSQNLIDQLNRKIALLDEYALTLQKQNLAKNTQTEALYNQLNQIRVENDILRSHLTRINQQFLQRQRKEQMMSRVSEKQIEKKVNSVNCSVDFDPIEQEGQNTKIIQQSNVGCQTQTQESKVNPSILHSECSLQISKLLSKIQQKDIKIKSFTSESQQMYNNIVHLQQQNQNLKGQIQSLGSANQTLSFQFSEVQTKFKTQSKQIKTYQLQMDQLKSIINDERQVFEEEKQQWERNWQQIQLQTQRQSQNTVTQQEIQRLIRQNNRLIEKVRMLQKEKNNFYNQLRGRNVSPLKTSQISNRQQQQPLIKNSSFIGSSVNPPSSDQKPQRFSSQLTMGKQKQKLKAERWKKIEEKINRVKEENQQLKANLSIV